MFTFLIALFRTFIWNIVFWFLLIGSQIAIPIFWILDTIGRSDLKSRLSSGLATFWSNQLLIFSGSKLEVVGVENIPDDHNYCIVSNHQGYFDIPIILKVIPWTVGFVAKKELAKIPFLANWMKAIGVIFLDRSDKRTAMDVMKRASQRVKDGQPMVIFPEGTRSKGGPVAPFKQGSLKLATLAKNRILPITIEGSHGMIETGGWGVSSAKMRCTIHPVINVEDIPEDEIQFLAERLRTIIVAPMDK